HHRIARVIAACNIGGGYHPHQCLVVRDRVGAEGFAQVGIDIDLHRQRSTKRVKTGAPKSIRRPGTACTPPTTPAWMVWIGSRTGPFWMKPTTVPARTWSPACKAGSTDRGCTAINRPTPLA